MRNKKAIHIQRAFRLFAIGFSRYQTQLKTIFGANIWLRWKQVHMNTKKVHSTHDDSATNFGHLKRKTSTVAVLYSEQKEKKCFFFSAHFSCISVDLSEFGNFFNTKTFSFYFIWFTIVEHLMFVKLHSQVNQVWRKIFLF